jgi:3-deoxy-7-phosphoheptulonate synthase
MPTSYQLAQRRHDRTRTVAAGSTRFGDGSFSLIGGPCSIEDADQIEAAAAAVRSAGGVMLRGGAYKPRTSPYDFQGLGDAALPLIATAARRYDLPVVVEVLAETQLALLVDTVDMLQIGARNMQNATLVRAAARTGLPLLLKRGPAASRRAETLHAQ